MSRHRILRRVREALERREAVEHPGAFHSGLEAGTVDAFRRAFEANGGGVELVAGPAETARRITELAEGADGLAAGAGVPAALLPGLPRRTPAEAPVGVSMARCAVAETGSLVLDARDGRRVQLLPPLHLVVVPADRVHPTLADALASLAADLPSALGLHSGPSKSADIGQILVEGVHGPGRVVALVVSGPDEDERGEERSHRPSPRVPPGPPGR